MSKIPGSAPELIIPDPEMICEDNPEWTKDDIKNALSFSELPEDMQATLRHIQGQSRKRRGINRLPTKKKTSIRFDEDVLNGLRKTGKGWQTRVNDVMREWLKQKSA